MARRCFGRRDVCWRARRPGRCLSPFLRRPGRSGHSRRERRQIEFSDRNLRNVILQIENSGCIELAALGVKHDVSGYYRNHVYIENPDQIGDSLVRIIDNFLV